MEKLIIKENNSKCLVDYEDPNYIVRFYKFADGHFEVESIDKDEDIYSYYSADGYGPALARLRYFVLLSQSILEPSDVDVRFDNVSEE